MGTTPFINTTSGLQPNAGVVGEPGAITATSSTQQTIGSGTMQFQVPTQAAWAPGMFVTIVDSANTNNYMSGVVTNYSGTALTVNVSVTNGSGIYSSWLINLSGVPG
jgi:hypothetical protein